MKAQELTKKVSTAPYQAKATMRGAKKLGLQIGEISVTGDWETASGEPVWPREPELMLIGTKYFHFKLNDGETVRCKPCSHGSGKIEVTFVDRGGKRIEKVLHS